MALLSAAGYLVTSETIRRDRDATAARRAQIASVRTQDVLGHARASVVGLGNVLAAERVPSPQRFAELAGSTAGSIGLTDAMWVRRVNGHLVATFTSRTRPELRPGVDVSIWPALSRAIENRASAFAVAASDAGALGSQPGFYLLESGNYANGPGRNGVLVVFVPRGWLTVSLAEDPRRVAVSLDGALLDGGLRSGITATTSFDALARHWQIDVGREPRSQLQSLLPWLAFAWPIAAALLIVVVTRGIVRRRRAEREVERVFDLSLDLLAIAGFDGYFKRVNPAIERTLGYSSEQLLSRPFSDFVHPEDRESTLEALSALAGGEEVVQFENRYVCSDGSARWLEWSTRPVPHERRLYAAARDVTDRRRAETQSRVLADEQAALRRVATLVARGAAATDVFDAVTAEVGQLLPADATQMSCYNSDGTVTSVARWSTPGFELPTATRWALGGQNVTTLVAHTGRPARIDAYTEGSSDIAVAARLAGAQGAVGAPIIVEGRVWGVMVASSTEARPLRPNTEARLAAFTELVATAIANATSRAELTASRARVVGTADDTRRRIERDLHDGTQQRLLSLVLALRSAEKTVPYDQDQLRSELSHVMTGLADAVDELREIARGIHPAILSRGGLGPALTTLARRADVPVKLELRVPRRLADAVEVAAYYVVSEALANVAKHARASVVEVAAATRDSIIELAVRDDGVGGADPDQGSGLIGLRDRVEALGGTIEISSSRGNGTTIVAKIPIDGTDELNA
ncbi:MAG: two-component system sensor kinase [Actinomycetia bacterium]|nr:two-component system sensor kinase [Actinomycetes bacterium]